MKEIHLHIKSESSKKFLKDNLVNYNEQTDRVHPDASMYHLMKDTIYLKKSTEYTHNLTEGETVIIEVGDFSVETRKEIVNIYTYKVSYYDDVAYKLELKNFKIELKDK
jgi:hypothetical protein